MLVVYVMPIIIELMFLPFVLLDKDGTVSLIEIIISTFAIPVYLIVASYKVLDNFNTKKILFGVDNNVGYNNTLYYHRLF